MRSRIVLALLMIVLLAGVEVGIPRENSRRAAACQSAVTSSDCGNLDLFASVKDDLRTVRETVASTLKTAADQWRAFDEMVSQLATATPAR